MDIKQLIANGENDKVEFKTSFKNDSIESIVAFANTKGGSLLISVNDTGEVIGVDLGKETLQNHLNHIKQNTEPSVIPDVEVIMIDGKELLLITVNEYPIKPVSYKGRYYKRIQNSNHLMTPTEIADMHLKVLNLSWDAYIYPDAGVDALDMQKIEKFQKRVNEIGRFSIEEDTLTTLQKLKLIKDNKPTIASMLLFAKEPIRTHIRVGRFKDDITIIDDRQITDTLLKQLKRR